MMLFNYTRVNFKDPIPVTPMTGLPVYREDYLEANEILYSLIQRYGMHPIKTSEKEGRLIHDIIPIEGKEGDYSNEGSDYFPFHVEVPQFSMHQRPDFIILMCLRGYSAAKTYYIPAKKLIQVVQRELGQVFVSKLWEENYYANYGISFGDTQEFKCAILSGDKEDPDITLDLAEMFGQNEEGSSVLNLLKKLIEAKFDELAYTFSLKSGDVLIFNNKKGVHARSNFKDQTVFDGSHRWLKRMYLKA